MKHVSALLVLLATATGCNGGPIVTGNASPIISGRRAAAGEVGATVALISPGDPLPLCTGTLVTEDVVVTAAHCVLTQTESGDFGPPVAISELAVLIGATDTASTASEQRYAVSRIWAHPAFPANTEATGALIDEHDVAAVILDRPVTGAAPVPLLDPSQLDVELVPRRMMDVAGYGTTDPGGYGENTLLHLAQLPFRERSDFEMIGGDPGGPDTCYGDSGGPAYVSTAAGPRLVGVTSRGPDPYHERCDVGTVFTIASAYLAMLEDVTGQDLTAGTAEPPPPPAAEEPPDAPATPSDAGLYVPPRDEPAGRVSRKATGHCTCTAVGAPRGGGGAGFLALIGFAIGLVRARRRMPAWITPRARSERRDAR